MTEPGQPLASPGDKLILIVDDDTLGLSLYETTIGTEGFKVITAVNGHDARTKLQSQTPDLIITDLIMPREGGFEFLRNLQAEGLSRVPIFVVTASKINDSTVSMIKAEANVVEFMGKPVPKNNLIAALHKHLGTQPSSPRGANRFR